MTDQSNAVGRSVQVSGAAIAGVVSCLPGRNIDNSHFDSEFGEAIVKDALVAQVEYLRVGSDVALRLL